MNKAIFLDRDGVINPLVFNTNTMAYESPNFPDEFSVYPYAVDALKQLKALGYILIIVSNQPSYAKGKTSLENLETIANMLKTYFEKNDIHFGSINYCHHHPEAIINELKVICDCRKPNSKFIKQAQEMFDLDLSQCYFIGDQDTDIECGQRMGLKTIGIQNRHSAAKRGHITADLKALNLLEAAQLIMLELNHNKGVTMGTKSYIDQYLNETHRIVDLIDRNEIEKMIDALHTVKNNQGRLFILGVGGSAGNASHAVNDFRKIGGIESYAPTDNVSEFTARANDEGWETTFSSWLKGSRLNDKDALLIFSVGGGSDTTSLNLKRSIEYAKECKATVLGIVSRDGGYTGKNADVCVLVPVVSDERITPHAEGWQGVVWHLVVNALVHAK